MIKRKYSIRAGYQIRKNHAPYVDEQPTGTIYQPSVYDLAIFIAQRGGFKYIIDIGAGSGEKLRSIDGDTNIIAIDYAPNIKALRKNLPNAESIDFNLENGIPQISEEILKQAVVISSDVIQHIIEPHKYLQGLSKISKIAPFLLVSTPDRTRARGPENFGPPANPFHVREWSIDELFSLLREYNIDCMIGHTLSNNWDMFKGTTLAISGVSATPKKPETPETVLAVMSAYNEEDIIEQSIKHLLSQGVDVHILDNWSTDNTLKIVKKLARQNKNVTFEMFPRQKPDTNIYEWEKILTRIEEVAASSSHSWIFHNDADELRLSPWKGVTLQQAISHVSSLGYTAVDFTVADFRPTRDGYDGSVHPDDFFSSFEFTTLSGYFLQVKGWKNQSRVDLASSGGHMAEFEGKKIFPLKFITKHYPLRSSTQANQKVFTDRKGRYAKEERKKGMHIQYDKYKKNENFIWNERTLSKYTNDFFYTEYIVELLSGIGIIPDKE